MFTIKSPVQLLLTYSLYVFSLNLSLIFFSTIIFENNLYITVFYWLGFFYAKINSKDHSTFNTIFNNYFGNHYKFFLIQIINDFIIVLKLTSIVLFSLLINWFFNYI